MPTETLDPRIEPLLVAWFGPEPESEEQIEQRNARWFRANPETDHDIEKRFGETAALALRGELDSWTSTARGRLAVILLLDQVPRQLQRGTAAAFAGDARALELTVTGIRTGLDLALTDVFERAFFYMPLQHAESLAEQDLGVDRFAALAADLDAAPAARKAVEGFAKFARLHRDIIARFGRFPHRNRSLGRESTPEETAYLQDGGPTFGQ